MKKFISYVLLIVAAVTLYGCDKVDNNALPGYTVRLNLGDYARWSTYGVAGAGQYRVFNREKQIPSNFPYDVNTYTGYGGLLLMMGIDMVPMAYDMACPIEARPTTVISIDDSNFEAVCPDCKSRFNVLTGDGGPISGMALNHKKGLTKYRVYSSQYGGYIVTNY